MIWEVFLLFVFLEDSKSFFKNSPKARLMPVILATQEDHGLRPA
jgi:hypothetical protein